MPAPLINIAPDIWLMPFPLKAFGVNMKRNVTIMRLASGKLIVHSTARFTPHDVDDIKALGQPAWLVDALLRHDTFAKKGRAAFPTATYLAPPGFTDSSGLPSGNLCDPPPEWAEEIDVLPIDGAPDFGEVVMFHRPSRTLIVADLLINFEPPLGAWTKFLLKLASVHGVYSPGVTKPFKSAINDLPAYQKSISKLLSWDFQRIIVGHGTPVKAAAQDKLHSTLLKAGLLAY